MRVERPLVGMLALGLLTIAAGLLFQSRLERILADPYAQWRIRHIALLNHGVDCGRLLEGRPLVLLVLGQSNAANHASRRFSAERSEVIAWWGGRCAVAADPLPGGSGSGGSVWIPLARQLSKATGRQVLLASVAVESTPVAQWTDRRYPLLESLRSSIRGLLHAGFPPDAILWQQGEADLRDGTRPGAYAASLRVLIRTLHKEAPSVPVWLARSTRCRNEGSEALREAQSSLVSPADAVFPGPQLDLLGDAFRYDGCHFNERGQQAVADAWFGILHGALLR